MAPDSVGRCGGLAYAFRPPDRREPRLGFARRVAGRVYFLDGGRFFETGPPSRFLENPETDRAREFRFNVLRA